MKKHGKMIRLGMVIILLSIVGMVEYIQLEQAFDLPQTILVLPPVGAVAMIFLGKLSFFVPICTAFLSCIYQIFAGSSNAIADLQTDVQSVLTVLLKCLSILIAFELTGMAGGALIRILTRKRSGLWQGIVCCVAGVFLIFAPYLFLFRNPLYPVQARYTLMSYADENFTDSPILKKQVYYSMQASDYQCRVVMAEDRKSVV